MTNLQYRNRVLFFQYRQTLKYRDFLTELCYNAIARIINSFYKLLIFSSISTVYKCNFEILFKKQDLGHLLSYAVYIPCALIFRKW